MARDRDLIKLFPLSPYNSQVVDGGDEQCDDKERWDGLEWDVKFVFVYVIFDSILTKAQILNKLDMTPPEGEGPSVDCESGARCDGDILGTKWARAGAVGSKFLGFSSFISSSSSSSNFVYVKRHSKRLPFNLSSFDRKEKWLAGCRWTDDRPKGAAHRSQ